MTLTALLLLLTPAGPSYDQAAADARIVATGRWAEARAALDRVQDLERAVVEHWDDRPDGPRDQLDLLIFAHEAAAEVRLRPWLGADAGVLDELRRLREGYHAAPDFGAPPMSANVTFLAGLARHRPGTFRALNQVPPVRTVLLAALNAADQEVTFDPAEPQFTEAKTTWGEGVIVVQIAARLDARPDGPLGLEMLLFEAFNTHTRGLAARLARDADRGDVGRDAAVATFVAVEQLSEANKLRVLRDHFAELAAAGLTGRPEHWGIGGFHRFVTPPPGLHHRFFAYPYFPYGTVHDWHRLGPAARGGRRWEAAVLIDRLRWTGRPSDEQREQLDAGDAWLDRSAPADGWLLLHRALPAGGRQWLCGVRGGESVERALRTTWAAVAAAVGPTFPF